VQHTAEAPFRRDQEESMEKLGIEGFFR